MGKTKTITISADELEEKIEAANDAKELKEGTRIKILGAQVKKIGLVILLEKIVCRNFANRDGKLELREFTSTAKETHEFLIHDDLKLAFDLLRSHLLIITEQKESFDAYNEVVSPQVLDNMDEKESPLGKVKVLGFDNSDYYRVSINGTKQIRGKQLLSLSTPQTYFEGFEDDHYEFGDELFHVVQHLKQEIELFYNGKYAPDSQLALEFDNMEEEEQF